MENQRPVRCSENEELVQYLLNKRQEMAAQPKGVSDNLDTTLATAYRNICNAKNPIKTLKDLSQIKGVGKWILRLMQGFFPEAVSDASPTKNAAKQKGKQAKGPKRYVPQKNSVAYALLITLYRAMMNGNSFMKKQELIDAAEASGLSRTSIAPDKSKMPGSFGISQKDWYTGWNCMKTLILKGLVVKSSCPAKYMLTQEGQEAARECLTRSGLVDSVELVSENSGLQVALDVQSSSHVESLTISSTYSIPVIPPGDLCCQRELNKITSTVLDKNFQGDLIDSSDSDSAEVANHCHSTFVACTSKNTDTRTLFIADVANLPFGASADSASASFSLRACTSSDLPLYEHVARDAMDEDDITFRIPPCRSGERFQDTYDVILVLDDRENFGSRSRKIVDNIQTQLNVLVEVRRLPVGDGLWIARHKVLNTEYVLDFIVERKKVDDLCSSIRDNRYRDQKLRLTRCGLRKLIYLVEGDPNRLEAAESIKTACFTTEILEGFDVLRTSGFADTVRRYGHLTQSIIQYYKTLVLSDKAINSRVSPSYDEFVKKCQDLEKMTVSDVFALQLMQVPQVTEEVALAVVNLFPTILSLAQAYSMLEGDASAQEEMLKSKSKAISSSASKNIFKLVWGS